MNYIVHYSFTKNLNITTILMGTKRYFTKVLGTPRNPHLINYLSNGIACEYGVEDNMGPIGLQSQWEKN